MAAMSSTTASTSAAATATATRPALPPGPPTRWWGLPLLRAMRLDYLAMVQGLHRDHGDITHMRLFNERAYDLFTPELVRQALVDHADHLVRWERGVEVFEQVFGRSVLTTEGATWQRQRRMLQPAFTPRRVAGYAGLMTAAAGLALDQALPAGVTEADTDMDRLISGLTMDVILRTLFSTAATRELTDAAVGATRTLSEAAMREMFWPVTLPDWLPLPGKAAKRHALRTLRGLVVGQIAQRRAQPDAQAGEDLLGQLLGLREDGTGAGLDDAELADQCLVSFQAGHETSATALLWWCRLLAEHPAVADRVVQEVDATLGGRVPGPDDLASLPWLVASLKEAMRLYPPIAALLTRRTTAPIELAGWAIPKGALLRITPWLIQRDARWFDAPDTFRPERFLPDAPPPPRGAWLPFGVGPRVCIGQHFAMLEMVLVGAMLLQRFRLRLPAGAPPAVPQFHVTLRPAGGLRLRLQRRG
ncbi:MAG: cytochrome P450 [Burkholderiales bacterium PBB5]|nr:MAG: cytochrome P450 [Burkholderiales bacterium PBB5]